MPIVDSKEMSPDDAMAKGLCPECGVDLKTVNPIAHRKQHWKTFPKADADGMEALRRMAMLDDFIVKNKVRTSDMPKPTKPNAAPVE